MSEIELAFTKQKMPKMRVLDAVISSASAPGAFGSHEITKGLDLTDGATDGDNESIEKALTHLRSSMPKGALKPEQCLAISIGTGSTPFTPIKNSSTGGISGWIPSGISDGVFGNYERNVNLRMFQSTAGYLRIQVPLPESIPMDTTDEKHLKEMKDLANEAFDQLMEKGLKEKVILPLKRILDSRRKEKSESGKEKILSEKEALAKTKTKAKAE